MNSDNGRNQITIRSFFLGILFTMLATFMAHYARRLNTTSMAIDHMPVAAISLFFVLMVFLYILASIIKRPLGLSSSELLIIYMMSFIGCTVTTVGTGYLLPIMAAPTYYATPVNEWGKYILPHIKSWLIPQDKEAVRQFFEGLPKGGSIPWMVWIKPLLCWLPFLMSLYMVMISIPIIMRKQWIEKERLQFPLAQLPLEMVKKEKKGNVLVYSFFHNKVMWLGFAIPFVISVFVGLHHYFHAIPAPSYSLETAISTFRNTQTLWFRISFPVIGFLYLVNLDIAFSLWFFALIFHALSGWFKITGISSPENLGLYGSTDPIFNHLGTGALIVFVLYGLWMARAHLKEVFRKAFTGDPSIDDSSELLSYRTAVTTSILGIVFMVIWLTFSGLSPIIAFLFVILALIIFLGITRIVIEAGVPTLISPGIATPQIISSVGTSVLGSSGLVSSAFTYAYSADIRTFVMSAVSTSLRIVEGIRKRRRLIFWAMLSAVLVALVTSFWLQLHLVYTYGGINFNRWLYVTGPQLPFNLVKEKMLHPTGINGLGWGLKTIGGGLIAGLMFMRGMFLWWPFHPIGFVIGSTTWIQRLWFSIFIAWLLKYLILKYGGPKIYKNARPFFLGLILGQYTVAGLWLIVDLITAHTGNWIFWI